MHNFNKIYNYSKDLHVLFVEDDTSLLLETSELLENYFSLLTPACDGQDALDLYIKYKKEHKQFYDLIITDINMPKKDGLELINDIKTLHTNQEIIVLSAYNESSRLLDLIHLGINNFIMKPIEEKQFSTILYTTCKNIYNAKQHDNFMLLQARQASMGKMIDSIAHQWIQPINIIKIQSTALELKNTITNVDKEYIQEYIQQQNQQIEHLTETLNEFRCFFRPNFDLEISLYKLQLKSVLLLLNDSLTTNSIKVEINLDNNDTIQLIANEFKHVLINIINNAIDAFNDKKIQHEKRVLIFNSYREDDNVVLSIEDSAGGIPLSIIDNIFDSDFTTKENGTGVGLYLSSQIISKIHGTLSVENRDNGAYFKISLKSHSN